MRCQPGFLIKQIKYTFFFFSEIFNSLKVKCLMRKYQFNQIISYNLFFLEFFLSFINVIYVKKG